MLAKLLNNAFGTAAKEVESIFLKKKPLKQRGYIKYPAKTIAFPIKKIFKGISALGRIVRKHPGASLTTASYIGVPLYGSTKEIDNFYKLGEELDMDKKAGLLNPGQIIGLAMYGKDAMRATRPVLGPLVGIAGSLMNETVRHVGKEAVMNAGIKAGLIEQPSIMSKLLSHVTPHLGSAAAKGIVAGVGLGTALAGKAALNLFDKRKAMQVFEQVASLPDFEGVPREQLFEYFQTILRFAPKVALDPILLRQYLKQAVVYGAVDPQSIKTLQDININSKRG